MRLLIITQKIDKNDSVLGFFHNWVLKMSEIFEEIKVICLEKGQHNFPSNVSVYSLGKEEGQSKIKYITNFYKYLNNLNSKYDSVFVHMNQEYILLAGLYWKIKKIPIYLWRNHRSGSFFTLLAVFVSDKVFCTSKDSFTARFKKSVLMPVGNDDNFFKYVEGTVRKKYSVCMLGRVSPVKNIDLGLKAINLLIKKGAQVSFDIIGSAIKRDEDYLISLKNYVDENNLSRYVSFYEERPLEKHPESFSSYEICLNLTDSGSFDKSIVGAASCGAIPLVSNKSLTGILPDACITNNRPEDVASSIERLMKPEEQIKIQKQLENFVKSNSLDCLMDKLKLELN